MQESPISWCDLSWNPSHGCSKVEPPDGTSGCTNCYAARLSHRWKHTTKLWTTEHAEENVSIHPEKLDEPYRITEPAFVFVNSMSDLFHSLVPESFIQDVFAVMRNCPHIVFQILTKRPGRAAHMALDWPPNVWMGTSVEDDRVTERIDLLRKCDAELLFISFEPLIGPVGSIDLSGYRWAIVGGESAPDADRREMNHAWAREIYRHCQEQNVRFYFKQSSARTSERGTRLTVYNPDHDIYEQRKIREIPEPARAVTRTREALQADAMAADGGTR
jgi:protein gp37